ncbi:MAG: NAD-binding protein, partial [Herbiconiux sp.]|nr:NAD-binding protein [Herbiconiux sp.]
SAVVVLADRDKVEMEEAIRAEVGATGRTRVICRRGDPMSLHDLALGSPDEARSIILLAPEGDDDPDSTVIKTALALTNGPRRAGRPHHVVGELEHPDNLEVARLVGRDEVHWVLAGELISRVTVQTCRQSGLSVVYTELLDFGGDEIYFTEQPTLVGASYGEAQRAFATSSVIGIVWGEEVAVNPPAGTVLGPDDRLIVIAADDSAIALAPPGTADESVIVAPQETERLPEHTLVLGCNGGLVPMLKELQEYVAAGSTVRVVTEQTVPELPLLAGLEVSVVAADPTGRAVLDALHVHEADHVIVLASENVPAQRADARTLITLLHLRDIAERTGVDLNVVSEMLDDRNRELAEVTNADDFIVSDKLVSLMLSQLSENRMLAAVFATLFSSAGSEIYLRPVGSYLVEGAEVDFYTVLEAASRAGETAIGYRIAADAHRADRAYGVHVNPPKGERRRFAPDDRLIVLAED